MWYLILLKILSYFSSEGNNRIYGVFIIFSSITIYFIKSNTEGFASCKVLYATSHIKTFLYVFHPIKYCQDQDH